MTSSSQNPKLRRFEERLHHQQRQLEHTMLTAAKEGRQAMAEDTLDVADQAVLSYQKELIFSQGTEGHSQLSKVRLALERLHEGTFGECMHCAKTIGDKRLEASARRRSKAGKSMTWCGRPEPAGKLGLPMSAW